jgi:hypothetical protein
MKNVTELRNFSSGNLKKIESGEITLKKSMELCRTSNALINLLRVEIDYHKLIKSKDKIQFLENNSQEV